MLWPDDHAWYRCSVVADHSSADDAADTDDSDDTDNDDDNNNDDDDDNDPDGDASATSSSASANDGVTRDALALIASPAAPRALLASDAVPSSTIRVRYDDDGKLQSEPRNALLQVRCARARARA